MVDDYIAATEGEPAAGLDVFLSMVPETARLLDIGCGTGRHAAAMARAGHDVLAIDGSAEMIAHAARQPGVDARQATFEQIGSLGAFGGVWASFSLLHAAKSNLPRHLTAIARILDPGGAFGIAMKKGTGEAIDRLGRFYAYYSEEELCNLLETAGLTPVHTIHGRGTGMAGHPEGWIVVLSRV